MIDPTFGTERRIVREERRKIADEYEALTQFSERVERVPVEASISVDEGSGRSTVTNTVDEQSKDPLKEAYEDTVMTIPHHHETHTDTSERRVGEVLGPEITRKIGNGGGFDSTLKQRTIATAEEACYNLPLLTDALDIELAALETYTSRVQPIYEYLRRLHGRPFSDRSIEELQQTHIQLDHLIEE